MKRYFININYIILIITILLLNSCGELSKSSCEEILDFSFTETDSIQVKSIEMAEKCAEKYHKTPEFLQKISQIYYSDAINNNSAQQLLPSTKKLFNALEYINRYFSAVDEVKSYDYNFRGEIYERLGDIYNDINSLKLSSELYNKAIEDYEKSNNIEKIINTLIKVGKLYQNNHIPEMAMIYFEMAEEKENIPQYLYRKIIDNKIVTLYETNNYKSADSIFNNHFNIKIQDYDFHSALGTKYFYERNYKKAIPHLEYCFEHGNQQEKLTFSEKLAESYFNLNEQEKEMNYIQYQAKSNSLEIRKTPLKLELEKLYDTHNKSVNNTDNKEKNNISLYIIIVLSVILVIIISFFIKKGISKKQNLPPENKTDKNTEVKTKTEEKISKDIIDKENQRNEIKENNENKELKISRPKQAVKNEEILSFEEAYKEFCNSSIYKKIKSIFEGRVILVKNIEENIKLSLSSGDIILLIKTFNKYFPNILSLLKQDYEGITRNDAKIIILSLMNFNDTEIAVLLGITYSASNKRTKKIKDIFGTKSDLSEFLFEYIKSNYYRN